MGAKKQLFARNAMGMEAMQNTRVPLEIRQNAGQAFRVSMADVRSSRRYLRISRRYLKRHPYLFKRPGL